MISESEPIDPFEIQPEVIVEQTISVVTAYLGATTMSAENVPKFIGDVHAAVSGLYGTAPEPEPEQAKPAVSIKASLQPHQITCLDCGLTFKSLKRHILTHHHLTPEEYRDRWNLPASYPMVAPEYGQVRRRLAIANGLGRKK